MASDEGVSIGRETPFPREIQGRWVDESDPSLEVIVDGSEITWHGANRDYQDKKVTAYEDGPLVVTLEFADQTDSGDSIQLVAWPDGAMHAYNDHFVSLFIRPET